MADSAKAPTFRYVGPIIGVEVYRNDVVVLRSGQSPGVEDFTRGVITEFSRKSRQRLAFIAANTSIRFLTMYTLTYPRAFPGNGRDVKRHLRSFLAQLARDCRLGSYLWCLEFQRRGAPHIHLWTSCAWPKSRLAQKALMAHTSRCWYRIVGSEDPAHLLAGTRVERVRLRDGAARYAVKEMSKMHQKNVPADFQDVGRFYGYSRDVPPEPICELSCTEDDVRGTLEGWRYAPKPDRMVWKVLYGVSDRFLEHHKE